MLQTWHDGYRILISQYFSVKKMHRQGWFVPGGRIYKNEDLEDAFKRISNDELGVELKIMQARLFGAFTHKFQTNALGAAG